ncbi:MAG: ABC transporter ATP-binding protein [Myxococcota bacterium]|nr:ABC transporter ATP-binding protein [Myxococcota bacterium]
MISARSLKKRYLEGDGREVRVLDGVDLEVQAGEFVAVVGPSGSGKSTLLHVLGGLDVDYQGEISVAGARITGLADRQLSHFRNQHVGFVFQSFHLVQHLPALENVLLPHHFTAPGVERTTTAAAREQAIKVLTRLGLGGKLDRPPERLSGGERQRVAIARALFARPEVLLCDEPTGNLDQVTGEEIIRIFRELNAEGLTVLVVTHEDRMSGAASRVLRLREGRLFAGAA